MRHGLNVAAPPWVALSLMVETDFRDASRALFSEGIVDAVEWTFDAGWGERTPAWCRALAQHYGAAGRLLGHGVGLSPLSSRFDARQAQWLARLTDDVAEYAYTHLSEHFGFCATPPFAVGPPMPVPFTPAAVRVGRDRLARMRDATHGLPIGLENLALALSASDVREQGAFLDALLEEVDGFVVLDLHNLYCQMVNFDVAFDAALASYPLARVRELHVSGGSWAEVLGGAARVRRDTHDERVPADVMAMLPRALDACPGVRAVVFERLGGTLGAASDVAGFADDFRAIRAAVARWAAGHA